MAVFGFNENDIKRIGRTVRLVERDPTKVQMGGPRADGAAPGVRLLLARHDSSSQWQTQSTAVVTVYNGKEGSVASAMTVVAYNHFIEFSADTNCTSRWVTLGHNGFNWHPVDSQSNCGTCVHEVGGIDFRAISGYVRTATQMLGHDGGGCVKWFDIATCATAAT